MSNMGMKCLLIVTALTAVVTAHPVKSSKCNKLPASVAYHGTCFFQYVKGRGFVRQQCPRGTKYNEDACACVGGADSSEDTSPALNNLRRSSVSVFSLLQRKAQILRSLLGRAPSSILRRIFSRRRSGGDDDDDGFMGKIFGRERDDEDNENQSKEQGGGGRGKGGLLSILSRGLIHANVFPAFQHKKPRTLQDVFNFNRHDDLDGRDDKDGDRDHYEYDDDMGKAGIGGNGYRYGDNDNDGVKGPGHIDITKLFNGGVSNDKDGGNGANAGKADGQDYYGAKSTENDGDDDGGILTKIQQLLGSGGSGGLGRDDGDKDDGKEKEEGDDGGILTKIQQLLGSRSSGGLGRDDGDKDDGKDEEEDDDGGILTKIQQLLGSGSSGGRGHDDGDKDDEKDKLEHHDDDNDSKVGSGYYKHGHGSPYSVKGMLTRARDYKFNDLLDDIFDDDDDDDKDDDRYGSFFSRDGDDDNDGDENDGDENDDDDDSYGGYYKKDSSTSSSSSSGGGSSSSSSKEDSREDEKGIFDDYENIYEKKFDGILEYVNKISNDIFNDDFDNFYEDLFDNDGYDDCFDDKYDHYFKDDYDNEIDDKYDDFDSFFSSHGDKDGLDNRSDNDNDNDDGNQSTTHPKTTTTTTITDNVYPKGSDKDDNDGVDDGDGGKDDDHDEGIWSGNGKFDIYDNLFSSIRNSGTQDSRLFNFGETLKGKGQSQSSTNADDASDIFDDFYKERNFGLSRIFDS